MPRRWTVFDVPSNWMRSPTLSLTWSTRRRPSTPPPASTRSFFRISPFLLFCLGPFDFVPPFDSLIGTRFYLVLHSLLSPPPPYSLLGACGRQLAYQLFNDDEQDVPSTSSVALIPCPSNERSPRARHVPLLITAAHTSSRISGCLIYYSRICTALLMLSATNSDVCRRLMSCVRGVPCAQALANLNDEPNNVMCSYPIVLLSVRSRVVVCNSTSSFTLT